MIEKPFRVEKLNKIKKPFSYSDLRDYFMTGVLITAPVGLTLYLAWNFIVWMDDIVTPYLPAWMNFSDTVPGVGLIAALVVLTSIGALMNGVIGSYFTNILEVFLVRVPVVKTIYTVIKQVLHTALADQATAFREAVMVEFPRKGIWVMGFVTSRDREAVDKATGQKMVSVLVPTTPSLSSGYVIFVPESEVKPVDIPPDQVLKMVISGGLI